MDRKNYLVKIVYLALAGGSLDHDVHKIAQQQTWASNFEKNYVVIWMHGQPSIDKPTLIGRDLHLPVEEKYENLLQKTLLSINWIVENMDFDILVRTNTSNYFFHPLVVERFKSFSSQDLVAGGVIAQWKGVIKQSKSKHTYISGAGIYLSFASAKRLCEMNHEEFVGVPDDVAIGSYLEKKGVRFFDIARNNITDFKMIWPSPQTRVKSWKNPEVTAQRMHEIHEIYQFKGEKELSEFSQKEIQRCRLEESKRAILLSTQFRLLRVYIARKFRNLEK
jgi:hypothetical protein